MAFAAEVPVDRRGRDCGTLVEPALAITKSGLVLGGTVLARMGCGDDGRPKLAIDGAEDRILALLAAVYGKGVSPAVLKTIRRAAGYWGQSETVLAEIELALAGLPRLADPEAARRRLDLAEKLLDAGVSAFDLIKACGLDPSRFDLVRAGYNPNQPRVPADNPTGGQWTSDGGSASSSPDWPTRSLLLPVKYTPVDGLPFDAKVVVPKDGVPIAGGDPPTLLMAPPRADFREVYAAGRSISDLPFWEQYPRAHNAIAQEGTYDFQRDVQSQKLYRGYIPAANYAVGVYMAGAGYSLLETLSLAKIYAYGHSSNYKSQDREEWITRGWQDAIMGRWK